MPKMRNAAKGISGKAWDIILRSSRILWDYSSGIGYTHTNWILKSCSQLVSGAVLVPTGSCIFIFSW